MKYGACITNPHTELMINNLRECSTMPPSESQDNRRKMVSVTEMIANLGSEPIEVRRSKIRLVMFYKIKS